MPGRQCALVESPCSSQSAVLHLPGRTFVACTFCAARVPFLPGCSRALDPAMFRVQRVLTRSQKLTPRVTPQLCGCRSCTARTPTLSWSWCRTLTTMPTHLGSCLRWSLSWRPGASLCSTVRCACLRCGRVLACTCRAVCFRRLPALLAHVWHAPRLMQCILLASRRCLPAIEVANKAGRLHA